MHLERKPLRKSLCRVPLTALACAVSLERRQFVQCPFNRGVCSGDRRVQRGAGAAAQPAAQPQPDAPGKAGGTANHQGSTQNSMQVDPRMF